MKKLIALAMMLALVLTAFAGCSDKDSKSSGSSYEDTLQNYLEMRYGSKEPSKKEIKTLRPQEMWDSEDGYDLDTSYNMLIEESATIREVLTAVYGDNYTISFEVIEKEEMDKDGLEEGREYLEGYGLKGKNLTKAYELELEVTIKGNEKEYIADGNAMMYQYGGTWYVDSCYVDMSEVPYA